MNFNIREIEINDYYKKYFDLLSQLTYAENVEFKKWEKQIQKIRENPYHHIFVIEDKGKIIASITLLVEVKIIRNLGNIAHIEDLVVSNEYRGKGLASKLLEHCIELSQQKCYKMILNCNYNLKNFYNKIGFEEKNIQMSIYFKK